MNNTLLLFMGSLLSSNSEIFNWYLFLLGGIAGSPEAFLVTPRQVGPKSKIIGWG